MSFILELPFKTDINSLLRKGKEEAQNHKGIFNGDIHSGKFKIKALGGNFEGVYEVKGQSVQIEFYKKPLFIPEKLIAGFLQTHIK